jgi:CheY-like chemotaxis protein
MYDPILVIDDEKVVRELIVAILDARGLRNARGSKRGESASRWPGVNDPP